MSGGRRVGQAALATACLVALLLAAAATPGAVGVENRDGTNGGPGERPGDRPGDQPGDQPSDQPGDRPRERPGGQPTERPGDRPGDQPGDQPGVGPGETPSDRPMDGEGDVTKRAPAPYRVAVVPEPAPGRTVTVLVFKAGEPVVGARVAFNDRRIGRTNAAGRVRGEVPYEAELVVRVTPP